MRPVLPAKSDNALPPALAARSTVLAARPSATTAGAAIRRRLSGTIALPVWPCPEPCDVPEP